MKKISLIYSVLNHQLIRYTQSNILNCIKRKNHGINLINVNNMSFRSQQITETEQKTITSQAIFA